MAGVAAAAGSGVGVIGSRGRISVEVCVVVAKVNGFLPWTGAVAVRGFGGHFARLAINTGVDFILEIGLVRSQRVVGLRVCSVCGCAGMRVRGCRCAGSVLSAVIQVTVHPGIEFVGEVGLMRSCGGFGRTCLVARQIGDVFLVIVCGRHDAGMMYAIKGWIWFSMFKSSDVIFNDSGFLSV